MAWDPRKQECRSYYGYGSGFFIREDQARAKAAGYAPAQSQMFCGSCPIAQECWRALQERVRVESPKAAAEWDKLVERNQADGIDPGRIAIALMEAGRPDPWMKDMLANMRRGTEAAEELAA